MRVVTAGQMKAIEQAADRAGLSYYDMMKNAGTGAARFITDTLAPAGKKIVVLIASGNNGGDGLVVARLLHQAGALVMAVLMDGRPQSNEARAMYDEAVAAGVPMAVHRNCGMGAFVPIIDADIVVDALFGTGFKGDLKEPYKEACRVANACGAVIVALDIPSGAECDSGRCDPGTVKAAYTLAFDSMKPIHTLPGAADVCGEVVVIDIGIPDLVRDKALGEK